MRSLVIQLGSSYLRAAQVAERVVVVRNGAVSQRSCSQAVSAPRSQRRPRAGSCYVAAASGSCPSATSMRRMLSTSSTRAALVAHEYSAKSSVVLDEESTLDPPTPEDRVEACRGNASQGVETEAGDKEAHAQPIPSPFARAMIRHHDRIGWSGIVEAQTDEDRAAEQPAITVGDRDHRGVTAALGDGSGARTGAELSKDRSKGHENAKDAMVMRLSRRIARSGIASRREAERMVEAGKVTVNGDSVLSAALNVGPRDVVRVGKMVIPGEEKHTPRLWMMHKTRGELVTRDDPAGRPTVFQRLARLGLPDTLMPVGRLDFNSEGLLLLTNDGDLARKLELPASGIVRTYSVRVYGNITEEKIDGIRRGVTIDGVRYKGMAVRVEGGGGKGREGRNAWLTIECTEGKNRQIRKICDYLCLKVNRLARVRYGPFSLGKVRPGGVCTLQLQESFLKRLEEGSVGGGGMLRRSERGSGPGARVRKGIGSVASRGQNNAYVGQNRGKSSRGVRGSRRAGT